MPDTDDRIRDALRATAREPSTEGVTQRVRLKRQRRQTLRKIEAGVLVAALVAAGAVISVNVLDENKAPHEIAVPPRQTEGPIVRVTDGLDIEGEGSVAKVTQVRIAPDEGFVRGPWLASGDLLTFAAYDRVGDSWDYPPSHIVRVEEDGTVVDRVDLKGEILSLAEGEGARWALTRDKTVTDAEFRVKRIGPDNVATTSAVPLGEQPVGDIVAGGGGVWVPVVDGVLRFDPVTGAFANKVELSIVAGPRAVSAAGKAVYATDGLALVRLDPASTEPAGTVNEVAVAGVDTLIDAANSREFVQLGRDRAGTQWTVISGDRLVELPTGLSALGLNLTAMGEVVWVDARIDGRYVFQLDIGDSGMRVARTLFISRAGDEKDVTVTFLSEDTLFVTSEGRLYRVQLSE